MLTPQTPRQIKTQLVKENILKVTTELIKNYGIEYVTVNNICKTANVSTGSFYHHFGNKDELLAYYLVDAFEKRSAEFEHITGEDTITNVLLCYDFYNQFLLDQGFEFIRNYYTTNNKGLYSHSNHSSSARLNMPLTAKILRTFEDGIKNGYIEETCDVQRLIYDLSVIEKGIIFDWCLSEGDYNLKEESHRLMSNYLLSAVVTDKYKKTYL